MKTSRTGLLLLAALASLPLACKDGGCGGGSGGAAPSATVSASAVKASSAALDGSASASGSAGRMRPPMVRAAGATGALFRAVNGIDLKPEQKAAVEKIGNDLREAERPVDGDAGARAEMKEHHESLVAGVRGGKIELAKMEPHYAAIEKSAKARQEREAEALGKLHQTLDATQRTAAVAAVRANDEKRAARMKAHDRPDGGAPSGKMRAERYTKDLELDADQQKKVEAILPKDPAKAIGDLRDEMKKRSEAVLASFEKETFDPKTVTSADTKRARGPVEEQTKFLAQLVSILTPTQREKLALKLERAGGDMAGRRRGGGSGGDREREYPEEDDAPID